jgi:cytochrome P450
MTDRPDDPDFLHELRPRRDAEGGVFWVGDGELAVFDADAAQRVNAENFADLTLPDRFLDLLRRRKSTQVSWRQVRSAWTAQLRRLSDRESVAALAARMERLLDDRLDQHVDLVWLAHQVTVQALLPVVVSGLPPRGAACVRRDIDFKLTRLLSTGDRSLDSRRLGNPVVIQVRAGLAVRREIRGRAAGRRPQQFDLTDPIAMELLPELGMDRAVDAVTAVLTAIAGPPGAASAALLYELANQPEWAARLADELAPIAPPDLYAAPTQAAPVTYRFVKEVLRMWSPPLMLSRGVRTDIRLPTVSLEVGERYLMSSYLIHHDPRHWAAADVFDPDRWLPDASNGPPGGAHYVPFGWAPKTCVGAGLGTIQLVLLCHLLCTRYRIDVAEAANPRMTLAAVPMPLDLRGRVTRRTDAHIGVT